MRRRTQRQGQAPKQPGLIRRNAPFVLFLLVMAFVGFLAQIQWVGYIVIGVYLLFAYTQKLPPKVTFMLALWALGVVPVAIVLGNWLVAQNFAAYSFVLFVVGVIMLIFNLQKSPPTK
jgi:hypothetical protein